MLGSDTLHTRRFTRTLSEVVLFRLRSAGEARMPSGRQGLRFSEHLEGDGEAIARHAWRARTGGHRLQAAGCPLQVRPQPYVAEVKNPDYARLV